MALLDQPVTLDPLDLLVPKEKKDQRENLDLRVMQENPANQEYPVLRAPRDQLDLPALLDCLDQMGLEDLAESRDPLDHVETL